MPDGEAGNFRNADICGHFRTSGEGTGVGRGFETPVGSGQLDAGEISTHQSSYCLSGFIGFVHVRWDVGRTNNIVERCFPSWQGGIVSEGRVCAKPLPLGAGVPPSLLPVFFRPYMKMIMAYFHFRGGGMKCWTGSCDFAHALFRHGLDLVEIGPTSSWMKDATCWAGCRRVSGRREETICSLFWWSGLGRLRGQNRERSHGFPPARERRENEKGLLPPTPQLTHPSTVARLTRHPPRMWSSDAATASAR